jgi:hypothetical protein
MAARAALILEINLTKLRVNKMYNGILFHVGVSVLLVVVIFIYLNKTDFSISIIDEMKKGYLGLSVQTDGVYHNVGKIIKYEAFDQGVNRYHNYLIKMSIDSVKFIRNAKNKNKCIDIKFYCGDEVHYIKGLAVDTFVLNEFERSNTYEIVFYQEIKG